MVIAEVAEMVKRITAPFVGKYSIAANPPISTGQVFDAFIVVPPEPKQGWGVTGLEVVVQSTCQIVNSSAFNSAKQQKQLWTIFLLQHDRADVTTLVAARDELLKRIPCCYQIYQSQTEVKMEKCTVRFESFVYVKQK